ncbi:INO80 complex subunit C [Biomphalaria glabrata]|uniref:Vps72/YL1 C-terminal domain-containing protein n=1 Tax=Biomphalaria glabrata TaxID=6526 RepID=A0A2C9KLG8_BIOGL|nr:INO80 complex subunit C-like [Biomphalaria glabrata]KAI8789425.1 INO80 complex subunit C [Biomphalaria glabrata]
MASVRKSSRSKSYINTDSPFAKRLKTNSPSLLPTPVTVVEENESFTIPDAEDAELIVEEVVVTEDVTTCIEDSQPLSDSLNDSLTLVQTTISAPGGQLLSEDTTDFDRPSSAFIFKDPNFVHSSKGIGGNKRIRVWKNLKQIVTAERALPWGPDAVTYGSIDAPPSFRPAKKYSDISGLEAKYTDPQTKMRFSNADEFRRVKLLPSDIIAGCLQLRKANTLIP